MIQGNAPTSITTMHSAPYEKWKTEKNYSKNNKRWPQIDQRQSTYTIALTYVTNTITFLQTLQNPQHLESGPGKNKDEPKSFRPIVLLSRLAKLTENYLLSDFTEYLLEKHQLGFRPEHSETVVLNIVTNNIEKDLNQQKTCSRTLQVALDFTASFDTVIRNPLLTDIIESTIPESTKVG